MRVPRRDPWGDCMNLVRIFMTAAMVVVFFTPEVDAGTTYETTNIPSEKVKELETKGQEAIQSTARITRMIRRLKSDRVGVTATPAGLNCEYSIL